MTAIAATEDKPHSAPDYNIQVRVRNGRLLARIRAAGFETVAAFCRTYGLSYGTVGALISLRLPGMTKGQDWRKTVILLSNILDCMPQDIIPRQHWQAALEKTTFELPMTGAQAAELVGACSRPDSDLVRGDLAKQLNAKLQRLPARLERCIRLRYGLTDDGVARTRKEIAELFNLSPERIHQMEVLALERLKLKPGNAKLEDTELQSYLEDLAVLP